MNNKNVNQIWCDLIIEEFIRNDVNYFFISPGSRSTLLTLAVANNKKSHCCINIDERSLAFNALGYSKISDKPAVIITTSGTALGNLLPAIIEAYYDSIPLIVISADRPQEIRSTGYNQTIDQVKIFQNFIHWYFEFPIPDITIDFNFILSTIDYAVNKTISLNRGPIHLNCPFREPFLKLNYYDTSKIKDFFLPPISMWLKNDKVYSYYNKIKFLALNSNELKFLLKKIKIKEGIILLATPHINESNTKFLNLIIELAKQLNWPIFPEIVSNYRNIYLSKYYS